MKNRTKRRQGGLADNHGAVGVMVALTLALLLGFSALSIDIGRALVVRHELQNAADASALAGARQLGQSLFYQDSALGTGQDVSPLTGVARMAAQEVGGRNLAEGLALTIPAADVQVGQWNAASRALIPTAQNPDAIQIVARRDGGANAPLGTFLGGILGVSAINVRTIAAARLSPTSRTDLGDLNNPFVISDAVGTRPGLCGLQVRSGFGGNLGITWFFQPLPAVAGVQKSIAIGNHLNSVRAGAIVPPATAAGQDIFSVMPTGDVGFFSSNPYTGGMVLLVPVLEGNVVTGGNLMIRGYATVLLTTSTTTQIQGTVLCNRTGGRRGGNATDFGTNGIYPALAL